MYSSHMVRPHTHQLEWLFLLYIYTLSWCIFGMLASPLMSICTVCDLLIHYLAKSLCTPGHAPKYSGNPSLPSGANALGHIVHVLNV